MQLIQLKGGARTEDVRLDRVEPPDWRHVEKYPLAELRDAQKPRGVPVVFGINWYANFDRPQERRGSFGRTEHWIGLTSYLGRLRGGHAIASGASGIRDYLSWRLHYDQGRVGGCVGASESRVMSLLNRRRYDWLWLYHEAQKADPWAGGAYPGAQPHYEGTTLRAGFDVLRDRGHVRVRRGRTYTEQPVDGIEANRWLTSFDEVLQVLAWSEARKRGAIPLLQSWGSSYPRLVWMPGETGDRLLGEDGECGVVTAR